MGEFRSGLWITGLILYFFLFFLAVSAVIAGSTQAGIDPGEITQTGGGNYETVENQFTAIGGCSGSITNLCVHTNAADNTSCIAITGCSFQQLGNADYCTGTHAFTCENQNQSFCELLDCTWTGTAAPTMISPGEAYDWGTVRDTISIMTGYRADIGVPGWAAWIFSFLFFWIPFFLLLWSIYMALPFLH